jgi:hypothetical protein
LLIRKQQIEELGKAQKSAFGAKLSEHLESLFPRHFIPLTKAEQEEVVAFAISQAGDQGFVTEIQVARYAELMCYFGAHFPRDPQAIWAHPILASQGDPAERSEALYQAGLEFWARIAGPENQFLEAAIARMRDDSMRLLRLASEASSEASLLKAMHAAYPEKAEAVGEEALRKLVNGSVQQATARGFASVQGFVLFACLSFALGMRFDDDPVLPWARRTLSAPLGDEGQRLRLLAESSREFLSRWK